MLLGCGFWGLRVQLQGSKFLRGGFRWKTVQGISDTEAFSVSLGGVRGLTARTKPYLDARAIFFGQLSPDPSPFSPPSRPFFMGMFFFAVSSSSGHGNIVESTGGGKRCFPRCFATIQNCDLRNPACLVASAPASCSSSNRCSISKVDAVLVRSVERWICWVACVGFADVESLPMSVLWMLLFAAHSAPTSSRRFWHTEFVPKTHGSLRWIVLLRICYSSAGSEYRALQCDTSDSLRSTGT